MVSRHRYYRMELDTLDHHNLVRYLVVVEEIAIDKDTSKNILYLYFITRLIYTTCSTTLQFINQLLFQRWKISCHCRGCCRWSWLTDKQSWVTKSWWISIGRWSWTQDSQQIVWEINSVMIDLTVLNLWFSIIQV